MAPCIAATGSPARTVAPVARARGIRIAVVPATERGARRVVPS